MLTDFGRVGPISVTRAELKQILDWSESPEIETWRLPWTVEGSTRKLPEAWLEALAKHNQEVFREKQRLKEQVGRLEEQRLARLGAKLAEERNRAVLACKRRRSENGSDVPYKRGCLEAELDTLLARGTEFQEKNGTVQQLQKPFIGMWVEPSTNRRRIG